MSKAKFSPQRQMASAIFFCSVLFFSPATWAQEASTPAPERALVRNLTISGHSILEVQPDEATFYVGVQASNEDSKVAMDEAAKASTAITDVLTKAGIDPADIATQGVQLNLVYEGGERGIFGRPDAYQANNTLNVTVRELGILPDLLANLADAGANDIGGLQFDISNREEMEDEAMLRAVDDAKRKAQKIAERSEVTLGKPLQIRFGVNSDMPVVMAMEMAADGNASYGAKSVAQVAISPGLIRLMSDVEIQYQLE